MTTLADKIEKLVKPVSGGLTIKQLSVSLRVSMGRIAEEVRSDGRFNLNIAIGNKSGYSELQLKDQTVEVLN